MSEETTRDPYNFDEAVPAEVPVTYKNERMFLREASGDAAARYRNAVMKATKLTDGKVSSIDGMADVEPYLVSLCLWRKINGVESQVPLDVVRQMPARMVKKLYAKARSISDLDEVAEQPLVKVLSLPGSPVTLERMREFAGTLGDDHAEFKSMLKASAEERAKN